MKEKKERKEAVDPEDPLLCALRGLARGAVHSAPEYSSTFRIVDGGAYQAERTSPRLSDLPSRRAAIPLSDGSRCNDWSAWEPLRLSIRNEGFDSE